MGVQSAAKRRRRQSAMGFRQLSLKQRPKYKKRDIKAAARKLAYIIAKEQARSARKGAKK